MNFTARELEKGSEILLVRPTRHVDGRGYFMETWTRSAYAVLGIDCDFVQDNQSLSQKRGTLRGLHFQRAPFEQAKLVRVLQGAIFEVAVDLRPDSANCGRWFGVALTADEGEQLFVPRGFAHGFVTLSAETVVTYKVDNAYSRESESGIKWNDPELNIRWPIVYDDVVLSDKDALLPPFSALSVGRPRIRAIKA